MPGSVETLADLAVALQRLRGSRSYADLARAVRPRRLAPATLSNLLTGKSVPTRETLVLFLTACGLAEADRQPWLAAWERVGSGRPPAGGVRVRDARPRLLGVHAAIRVGPVDGDLPPHAARDGDLPPYVSRDVDGPLRAAVGAAAVRGGFVLLVGGSSVGKTRALVEAVRTVLPQWWLTHPGDARELRDLATDPPARTVVWLDELQRYLDGLTAGTVRTLVAGGAVLVATLWPGEYGPRVAPRDPGGPDPHERSRAVLGLAEVITVPAVLSGAERRRAEALAGDRRIRTALDTPDAGFTQVLAAGPQLIRRWEGAPGYARAVLTAALDARRVGALTPVTVDFLAAAAPGYLTATERATATADWLDAALAYATTPLHGATAALCPVGAGMGEVAGYAVADYLHQHARRVRRAVPLPDPVWRALLDHHHPDDTVSLADHAESRGRYRDAAALYERAADDDRLAARRLDELLHAHGRVDELRGRAAAGDTHAAHLLTYGDLPLVRSDPPDPPPADAGDLDELRQRAATGDPYAAAYAADLLRDRGDLPAAVALLRAHVDADRYALYLADLHHRSDRGSDLFADLFSAWVSILADKLADLLHALGDDTELAALAAAGHARSADRLAALLAAQGREDELRLRTDPAAVRYLAELLVDGGRAGEALEVLHRHPSAWTSDGAVLDLLVRADLLDELRALADDGNWYAAERLVSALVRQGRWDEVEGEVHAGTPGAARAAGRRWIDGSSPA